MIALSPEDQPLIDARRQADALEQSIERKSGLERKLNQRADRLREIGEQIAAAYDRRAEKLSDIASSIGTARSAEEETLWALEEKIDAGVLFEETDDAEAINPGSALALVGNGYGREAGEP